MKTLFIRLPAFKGDPRVKFSNKNFTRVIKVITWILSINSAQHYYTLKDRIEFLNKKSGPTFTVQYLKESVRIIQKFIAGQPCEKSLGVSVTLINGLPKLVPGQLRGLIRGGDQLTVRAVLTVLSLYKILKCRPNLKINSITDPFTGISRTLYPGLVVKAMSNFPSGRLKLSHTIVSVSAGPNHRKAYLSLPADAFALADKPRILLALRDLACGFGATSIYATLKSEITFVKSLYRRKSMKEFNLGKLSFLEEAAGKVRVVAILDGWTQMLLSGFHDTISTILRNIPQDGTFDQGKPIDLLPKKSSDVYSFDLSSATDRLPIDVQCQVIRNLSHLVKTDPMKPWEVSLGPKQWAKVADAWKTVLTERDYFMKSSKFNLNGFVKYSVGQPMGCLSSFNMLALTHHMIVQAAAINCGIVGWFTEYALLGDDIVICNRNVAMAYKAIMQNLGLELSPSKGLESPKGVFEFCKRLIGPEGEYSPLGMKGIGVALKSPAYLTSLFVDLAGKGYNFTNDALVLMFSNPPSFIIKTKRVRDKVLWTLLGTFGLIPSGTQIGPGKTLDSSASTETVSKFLDRLHATSRVIAKKDIEKDISNSDRFLKKLDTELDIISVLGFHRTHILSLIPPFMVGWMNAVALYFTKAVYIEPISWKDTPSYMLVKEHIEYSIFASRMDQENFSLIDTYYRGKVPTWESQQELFTIMRMVANGMHRIVPSIQDFIKETKPPILRIGERVLKFWVEFDSLTKTFDPTTLTHSKCWNELVVPWTRPKRVSKVKKGKKGTAKSNSKRRVNR